MLNSDWKVIYCLWQQLKHTFLFWSFSFTLYNVQETYKKQNTLVIESHASSTFSGQLLQCKGKSCPFLQNLKASNLSTMPVSNRTRRASIQLQHWRSPPQSISQWQLVKHPKKRIYCCRNCSSDPTEYFGRSIQIGQCFSNYGHMF